MSGDTAVDSRPRLRILLLLTWYTPHLSGLTMAAKRLAEGLHNKGHSVTVLTSQHAPHLASAETINGVRVVREPVTARMSKGLLMPGYIRAAAELAREHDIITAFLPAGPFECIALRRVARLRPLILEYICDIRLPGGLKDRAIEQACNALFRWAARPSHSVVFSSPDYASTSPFRKVCNGKMHIAPLPIAVAQPIPAEVARLRAFGSAQGPTLAMAGRLAYGKGFELMIEALPLIQQRYPGARVLCAGEHERVVGEEEYRRRILPRIEALGEDWRMLGVLQPDLASFFTAADVLVFPSTNRTESFGMVQAEAMLCGVPVVASDLPGIRVAVQSTGMGKLFPAGDVRALGDAVIDVIERRADFVKPPAEVQALFSEEVAVSKRLDLYYESIA